LTQVFYWLCPIFGQERTKVITMEMLGKIRRMYLRDGLSLHEIAKRTGLSRNTIRGWVRKPGEAAKPTYRRTQTAGILTPFHEALNLALKADAHRTKQNRRTARALFAQIEAQGYGGGYTRVTDFIRAWRGNEGRAVQAFVPLKFDLGEAFQFDWSEEGLVVGGIFYKVQVAHMKLCASRAFWLVAYPSQGHEMLFDAHTRSFTALGGIARRGIYDLHVDSGGQGLEGQGPSGQRTLCRDVRALPVRCRLLQRR
jgi:transposase